MIVRKLSDARQTARRVVSKNWESTRLILKSDAMGFSFHITTIYAGTRTRICYRHHLESVYCIAGRGEIEILVDGNRHDISPGTLYALDKHDEHELIAHTDLLLACVFSPALTGSEVHDATGAYPPDADAVVSVGSDQL
ncbi:MAG: ectoine synthase [Steroidobacteraceae bacterium]